jgi:hypothetical protein
MDDFESGNADNQNFNDSIPLESGSDNLDADETGVSHAPLDLGGSRAVEIPRVSETKQIIKKPAENVVATQRIAGVRTFFTKLHAGAINFLDEQITEWLKKNPDIIIKRTNVTVGEIQAKKTEPNILITVWY